MYNGEPPEAGDGWPSKDCNRDCLPFWGSLLLCILEPAMEGHVNEKRYRMDDRRRRVRCKSYRGEM